MKKFLLAFLLMPAVYLFVLAGLMYRGSQKKPSGHPDTLLVLGAKVKGKPAYPSQMLKERLDHAVHVHKCYPESQIIVSGGQGPDESEPEAVVMKRYLIAQGIPSTCIRTEVKSSRTKENLLFSQKRFGFNDLVIITSDYHMFRALFLAKRLHIRASGSAAKSKSRKRYKNYLKELLAISHAFLCD